MTAASSLLVETATPAKEVDTICVKNMINGLDKFNIWFYFEDLDHSSGATTTTNPIGLGQELCMGLANYDPGNTQKGDRINTVVQLIAQQIAEGDTTLIYNGANPKGDADAVKGHFVCQGPRSNDITCSLVGTSTHGVFAGIPGKESLQLWI